MFYNHKEVETKWQKYWDVKKTFKTKEDDSKKNFYVLDMFPYPSGSGLHVGHPEGYTATDILARFKRMQGHNVLHPMGWDAFGLPTEQYAIKSGNSPIDFTYENIGTFKRQIKSLGFSYDWDKELLTCEHNYYKWTQWIFTKIYEMGLAELKEIEVNWCSGLGTVLANDEIEEVNGKMLSERGGYPVVKKAMKQWVLKITKYADRLLEDLDIVDWPNNLKEMQRNWIGKSIGAEVDFKMKNSDTQFTVFTTRPDTLFGVTYCVIAPENDLVLKITTSEHLEEVKKYIEDTNMKSELDRNKGEKTGVFTGAYAINPITNKEIPIWIADYVLNNYGSGAVMAVPAHDARDYDFAKNFDLEFKQVLEGDLDSGVISNDGKHINSDFLNGENIEKSNELMIKYLEDNKLGRKKINYKLRDWVFSRQRYWGEPFPVIHNGDKIEILDPLKEDIKLPKVKNIKPSGTGESPLVNIEEWLNYEKDGVNYLRDTNTMPQTAGSSWYYIAYILMENGSLMDLNTKEAKEKIKKWLPVDMYIGGAEHAVSHLLYSRFWHKVLFDLGFVDTKEPFMKLFNQGMILGTDNQKMSKSKGNVVNPDDIVESHGADTLRLYEMFMGPLEQEKPWSVKGVDGARKFIDRVYRLYTSVAGIKNNSNELDKTYHQTVKKVTEDYEKLSFNTAISQLMIFVNEATKLKTMTKEQSSGLLKMLNPIIPHVTEELWEITGEKESITYSEWPTYDEEKLVEANVTVIIQVNGKLRDKIIVKKDTKKDELEKVALSNEKIMAFIEGKNIVKVIAIPNKLVNIVAK